MPHLLRAVADALERDGLVQFTLPKAREHGAGFEAGARLKARLLLTIRRNGVLARERLAPVLWEAGDMTAEEFPYRAVPADIGDPAPSAAAVRGASALARPSAHPPSGTPPDRPWPFSTRRAPRGTRRPEIRASILIRSERDETPRPSSRRRSRSRRPGRRSPTRSRACPGPGMTPARRGSSPRLRRRGRPEARRPEHPQRRRRDGRPGRRRSLGRRARDQACAGGGVGPRAQYVATVPEVLRPWCEDDGTRDAVIAAGEDLNLAQTDCIKSVLDWTKQ